MPKHSTSLRDAALRRLGHLNRWLIAGSLALTAVLTEVAASAFPGKTLKKSASGAQGLTRSNTGNTHTQPVKPPVQAPTATPEGEARAESPQSGESASAQEPAPTQESSPPPESSPSGESAPAQESAPPASEPAPAPETAPTPAPAPAEQAPPVVSGGS